MISCTTITDTIESIKLLEEWEIVETLQNEGLLPYPKPLCEGGRIIRIRRTKYKCIPCGKEFSPKKNSEFESVRLPYWKILAAYKLYLSGIPANFISQILNISKPTMRKLEKIFKDLNERSYPEVPVYTP